MSPVNDEINCMLGWTEKCLNCYVAGARALGITNKKFDVSVITLPIQDNAKL